MNLSLSLSLKLAHFDLRVAFDSAAPVIGIFGPSGSGKTSLLEAIAGLRHDAAGHMRMHDRVWLDSARGVTLPSQQRDVGWVPQSGLLFPHLDVRHNLLAGAQRARARGIDVNAIFDRVCAHLELAPLLTRSTTSLSGGERQRVALGRALCSGPRLLLLDEPFASLDLPVRHRLWPRLRALRQELNVPMLLVSHDPAEVQALCDELIALREGNVIARGTPHDVLTDRQVFALAEQRGVINLLNGRLASSGTSSIVDIARGVQLHCRALEGVGEAQRDASVLVSVAAQDVMLATHEPIGLSARNILPARVEAIRPHGDVALVTLSLGADAPQLFAEVADSTCARLGIVVGSTVHAVIKATSCSVFGV